MIRYDNEIIAKVYLSDFLVNSTISYNAAANEVTQNLFLSKKAEEFLDIYWLSGEGLDGNFHV